MKIQLNNSKEINVVKVDGRQLYYQNCNRETLEIYIDKNIATLDEVYALFSDEKNIKKIKIFKNNEIFVHDDFSLKVSLKIEKTTTDQTNAIGEEQIVITLAKKSYSEKQLEQLQETVTLLEGAVAEMAYGGAK